MTKQTEYKSDIDSFLQEFDEKPEAHSESRAKEEDKYAKINKLRDEAQSKADKGKLWKDF